jgi:heme O synthase-like polyprenyltransferase
MILSAFGLALNAAGFACALLIVLHAFGRSTGTGFMVLGIPFYILYYAFSQFEHPRKNVIIAGFIGCLPLGTVLLATWG